MGRGAPGPELVPQRFVLLLEALRVLRQFGVLPLQCLGLRPGQRSAAERRQLCARALLHRRPGSLSTKLCSAPKRCAAASPSVRAPSRPRFAQRPERPLQGNCMAGSLRSGCAARGPRAPQCAAAPRSPPPEQPLAAGALTVPPPPPLRPRKSPGAPSARAPAPAWQRAGGWIAYGSRRSPSTQ
jgi:hypothetical protein